MERVVKAISTSLLAYLLDCLDTDMLRERERHPAGPIVSERLDRMVRVQGALFEIAEYWDLDIVGKGAIAWHA